MAPVVDSHNPFELPMVETPGKKRKRNADTNPFYSFSDQTFSIPSSTPIHNKQIDGSAFENPSFRLNATGSNKENYNLFCDSFLEVKSIADLASATSAENPFEVVRKPPAKKKKKNHDMEESCFVNPGLNLNAADKPAVNPFEVVRNEEAARKDNESCFVNGALNIRGKDGGEGFNPFEIIRPKKDVGADEGSKVEELKGIENPAMEMPTYTLAVPFTPSINRRINFQDLPANALTPCQMLANNLVFSPDPTKDGGSAMTPKRNTTVTKRKSLSVISEEPLDSEEDLHCYRLELDNSINEEKVRRQKTVSDSTGKCKSRRSLIDIKHISNLSSRLQQLEESEAEEIAAAAEEEEKKIHEPSAPVQTTFTVIKETITKEEIRINVTNPDVQFEEVDDFEDEEQDVDLFANPAPFQRAYRKKEDPKPEVEFKQPVALESNPSVKPSIKVKEVIRRSFRKLMHPKHQELVTDLDEEPKPQEPQSGGLIASIRHSLRRKAHKSAASAQQQVEQDVDQVLEMSIIAEGPRTVFKQPSSDEYKPIAGSSGDKVGSSLRSSLRRSTKDMKKHMIKNVFNK